MLALFAEFLLAHGRMVLGMVVVPRVGGVLFPEMGIPEFCRGQDGEAEAQDRGNDDNENTALVIYACTVFFGEE